MITTPVTLSDNVPARVRRREANRRGLFDAQNGTGFTEAVHTSLDSLRAYGARYPHWVITYSGGKDSSALVTFVLWSLAEQHVARPRSLTLLYADTRVELPPLHAAAMQVIEAVRAQGYQARIVEPPYLKRLYVNILGRGLPPPNSWNNRWCTRMMKAEPMDRAMRDLERQHGTGQVLFLTGVRMGESQARDQRISTSCSTDDGECGQGWFQQRRHALAPLLHWRVCWVWKWIYSQENPLPVVRAIEPVYAADDFVDIRTGCMGCPVVSQDVALHYLVKRPEWAHLAPFEELRGVFDDMARPEYRLRRPEWVKADGTVSKRSHQLGPLTIEARRLFFDRIRDIERRANYRLISDREETLIQRLWRWKVWPRGWTGTEPRGDATYERLAIAPDGTLLARQLALPFFAGEAVRAPGDAAEWEPKNYSC